MHEPETVEIEHTCNDCTHHWVNSWSTDKKCPLCGCDDIYVLEVVE